MLNIDLDALQAALQQLDQAIYYHEQWSKEIVRSIVCQLPFDSQDVAEDAHCHCRFGQWYYGALPVTIREHPAFLAIENQHRQLHQYAGRLLITSTTGVLGVRIYCSRATHCSHPLRGRSISRNGVGTGILNSRLQDACNHMTLSPISK